MVGSQVGCAGTGWPHRQNHVQRRAVMSWKACFGALLALLARAQTAGLQWSADELKTLRSLSLQALGPIPADPSNRVADDPAAAELGRSLFSDARFSSNRKVSCASCHQPANGFTDNVPTGRGVQTGTRRTMPIAGAAYSPWQFWDGRADSMW